VLHLAEAARLDPNYLEAQAQLGVVYVQTGRASEALDCFERALAIEPNSAALNITKAGALLMLGRSQEAEQAARRALQLAPASIEASYILGMALFDQGQTARAVEQLAVAAEKFPHAGEVLRSIQQQR
jgi:tetratricopeptide (TPR) repeat protein